MYLVVVEADDGTWLSDPEGFDTLEKATAIATRRANRYGRPASIYSCTPVKEVEPPRPESIEEWAAQENLKAE